MKEYRKKYKVEFQGIQEEVNANFMKENKERLIRAHRRDLDKERTSIIKIAMHTKNQIMRLYKKEIDHEERDKWRAVKEMKKLRERQMYLQAIHIDHEAPTPPPAVLDHEQYFERLQNLALLAEKGQYEEMEKVLKNQEIVDEKNMYLQPIFRNIKKAIRFITKTEEAELTHRLKVEGREADIPAEIQKLREKDIDPIIMIKKLERHITSLFHLIANWVQYVEVIYLPESKVQTLKHLRLHSEDRFKEAEEHQKEYLKKILKSEDKEEELKYQTVDEGLTSDTAESEFEGGLNKHEQQTKNEAHAEETTGKAVGDEDSILGQLIADEENKEAAENSVLNFAHDKTPKFDEKRKKEISIDYDIGDNVFESFKTKIQERGNIKKDDETTKETEGSSSLDMYGVQAEFNEQEENAKNLKEEEQKQYIAEQLLDMSHQFKNEYINETILARPDSGIDPFNPPAGFTEYISKSEEKGNISSSLVLEHYYKKLDELHSELSSNAKNSNEKNEYEYELETIEKLKKLLDYMNRIKIIDSQVLAELYDTYRYKI